MYEGVTTGQSIVSLLAFADDIALLGMDEDSWLNKREENVWKLPRSRKQGEFVPMEGQRFKTEYFSSNIWAW